MRLVLSGHDHMGGYAQHRHVHFVTVEAMLEGKDGMRFQVHCYYPLQVLALTTHMTAITVEFLGFTPVSMATGILGWTANTCCVLKLKG